MNHRDKNGLKQNENILSLLLLYKHSKILTERSLDGGETSGSGVVVVVVVVVGCAPTAWLVGNG